MSSCVWEELVVERVSFPFASSTEYKSPDTSIQRQNARVSHTATPRFWLNLACRASEAREAETMAFFGSAGGLDSGVMVSGVSRRSKILGLVLGRPWAGLSSRSRILGPRFFPCAVVILL